MTPFGGGSYNGVTFAVGGTFEVAAVSGWWDLPDLRAADVSFPLDHGVSSGTDYAGGRTVTLDVLVRGTSPADLRTQLDALVRATAPQPAALKLLGEDSTRWVGAKPRRRLIPYDSSGVRRTAVAVVEFFCPDPRRYMERPTGVVRAGGGTDLTLTQINTTGGNVGTVDAPMAWWVTAPSGGSVTAATLFQNDVAIFSWSGTVPASQFLVVSFRNRTVLLNNDAVNGNVYHGVSTFAGVRGVPPGGASYRASITTTAGTATSFLRYQDAWL